MITQKDLEQLAVLKAEVERSTVFMENFQQDVAEAVTEIAFKYYPSLKEMDSSYIQQFGDVVSRNTWDLAMHVDHISSQIGR